MTTFGFLRIPDSDTKVHNSSSVIQEMFMCLAQNNSSGKRVHITKMQHSTSFQFSLPEISTLS